MAGGEGGGNGTIDAGTVLAGSNPLKDPVNLFVLQVILVILLAKLLQYAVGYLKQPRVVGEVLAGVILGLSALSKIEPFKLNVFTEKSLKPLEMVAQFGLVFQIFLIGIELDPKFFIRKIQSNAVVSLTGTLIPFAAVAGISYYMYTNLVNTTSHAFTPFFLFVSTTMSMTTFPSVARIIAERKLLPTPLGRSTLSVSAVFDVLSWSLLVFVVALAKNTSSPQTAAYIFLVMVAYAAFLWLAVRPLLIRWVDLSATSDTLSQNIVYIVLCLVLVSAFFTHSLGSHAIFGGVLVGVIVPHSHSFAIHLVEKLEDLLSLLFLPVYFFFVGQWTQLDLLDDGVSWASIFMLVAVSSIAKIFATGLAANQVIKLPLRESMAMGVLMNNKGLLEFVALYIGYQSQILEQKVYTILLVSVILTNFVTVPLVAFVYPKSLYAMMGGNNATAVVADDVKANVEVFDEKGALVESSAAGDTLNVLAYLPGMQSVPTMMAFTDLLHHSHTTPLSVTALRLVRLSDRPSTIMIANESESALKQDAAMSIFKTFGNLSRIRTEGVLSTSVIEEFPDQIVASASQLAETTEGKTMIVLPWQDLHHNRHQQDSADAEESLRNLLTADVMRLCPLHISVAVLIDRGFGSANLRHPVGETGEFVSNSEGGVSEATTSATANAITAHIDSNIQRVCVPFFGGADDREALLLALRLSKAPNVQVTVLRILAPSSVLTGGSSQGYFASATPSLPLSSSPPSSTSNAEDEALLQRVSDEAFTTTKTTANPSPPKTNAAPNSIVFEEIPTSAPISVFIARAHDMLKDGKDLVVMGYLASQNVAVKHWMERELCASIVSVRGGGGAGGGGGGGLRRGGV
ncbi:K(+)/H(+) antiporter [Chytridiales sp. JEL 0842]|nr:K(+)/H(+) antiporter [Chytridiales sp. JEL 0842]